MSLFEKHVFVCVHGKTCPTKGSEAVWETLRTAVKDAGLAGKIRVNKSGCLAQCNHGPMTVTYPEGTWHGGVTVEDVPALLQEHLIDGKPVEHLRYPKQDPA